MLMFDECSMWRLIYSKLKNSRKAATRTGTGWLKLSFSCGAQLEDADIPEHLKDTVFVCQMSICAVIKLGVQ